MPCLNSISCNWLTYIIPENSESVCVVIACCHWEHCGLCRSCRRRWNILYGLRCCLLLLSSSIQSLLHTSSLPPSSFCLYTPIYSGSCDHHTGGNCFLFNGLLLLVCQPEGHQVCKVLLRVLLKFHFVSTYPKVR